MDKTVSAEKTQNNLHDQRHERVPENTCDCKHDQMHHCKDEDQQNQTSDCTQHNIQENGLADLEEVGQEDLSENAQTGVLFLNERLEDLSKLLKTSTWEYRVRKVNKKWGCLLLTGESIDDLAVREVVLQLSHDIPFIYHSLEEQGWEYRIFNRGEECAAFRLNFQPISSEEEIRAQLSKRNQVLFKLFELTSSDINQLERSFTSEKLTISENLWKYIGTFCKLLQLPDRGWANGAWIVKGEKENQRYAGYTSGDFMVGKANKDTLGFPGFFKLWLLIWIRPREVMRYIVDGSFKGSSVPMILGISMLMPILQCIMGRQKEALGMLILLIIPAILINLATFFLSGFFFKWTGRLLDGKGDYDELRAVVAWSYPIKLMSTVGLYGLSMLFFNKYVTVSLGKFIVFFNFNFSLRLVFFLIISALIIFWYLWVYISCLKEVQRFSYGKAVANFLMTALIYYLGLIIIGILGVLI